jgi:hypothetical protein
MLAPFWLVIMSLAIFPVEPKLALTHSVKATVWACEDSLFYLEQELSTTKNEIKTLKEKIPAFKKTQVDHAELAIKLKPLLTAQTEIEKGLIIRFIMRTPFFIMTLYRKTIRSYKNQSRS